MMIGWRRNATTHPAMCKKIAAAESVSGVKPAKRTHKTKSA
jgi:hypothetical protein